MLASRRFLPAGLHRMLPEMVPGVLLGKWKLVKVVVGWLYSLLHRLVPDLVQELVREFVQELVQELVACKRDSGRNPTLSR